MVKEWKENGNSYGTSRLGFSVAEEDWGVNIGTM